MTPDRLTGETVSWDALPAQEGAHHPVRLRSSSAIKASIASGASIGLPRSSSMQRNARSIDEKAAATHAFADQFLPAIASGEIKPIVDRTFPAAEAKDAYKYLASNESFGKVVLEF